MIEAISIGIGYRAQAKSSSRLVHGEVTAMGSLAQKRGSLVVRKAGEAVVAGGGASERYVQRTADAEIIARLALVREID